MIGDLALTPLGRPVSNAGIVPRVLHALFGALKDQDAVIKVSFMEIYNEEIRDLLVPPSDPKEELKVFSDQTKGAWVRGLEEVGVSTLQDGLRLLVEGTARRQVAQTLMNAQSSCVLFLSLLCFADVAGCADRRSCFFLADGRIRYSLSGSTTAGASTRPGPRSSAQDGSTWSIWPGRRVWDGRGRSASGRPRRATLTRVC